MQPGAYVLSRDTLSIGGDYTLADGDGVTAMSFDGKVRVGVVFAARDADGRTVFTGREHVLDLDQQFDIERDGATHGTLRREFVGKIRLLGEQPFRYVVACHDGTAWRTTGNVSSRWTVVRGDAVVARVDSHRHVHDIELVDGVDAAFAMTLIMAVVRLNPPSRHDSPA